MRKSSPRSQSLAARGDQDALSLLQNLEATAQGDLKKAAADGIADISGVLALWNDVQNVWYGVSLGSVLLLAAIGLAITFGVMGVINMAHGEMVMIGAYTTYLRAGGVPRLLPRRLRLFAVRRAARRLPRRRADRRRARARRHPLPLWPPAGNAARHLGPSLILQQAVRSIFGPSNREVGTPSWMSGTVEITRGLTLTSNRIAIVVFAAMVFVALMLVMRYTTFGLQMRAVTQNRSHGQFGRHPLRLGGRDDLRPGLGDRGHRGRGAQPDRQCLPQSRPVLHHRFVPRRGVRRRRQSVGHTCRGLDARHANKFLEPYAGAVLGKILILVVVILFIQRRPRGLFALKGRSVEA